MYLIAVLLTLLSTLGTHTTATTIDCVNIKPHKPFFLTAQYTLPNGTVVAKLLNPTAPQRHYPAFVLEVQPKHYNRSTIIKTKLFNQRLVFYSKFPPGSTFGPVIKFFSRDLDEGKNFVISASSQPRGTLGLIDTDIPGQGDAGCAVLIDKSHDRGFTLCNRYGEQVVGFKRYNEAEDCRKILLVAVNDPPY